MYAHVHAWDRLGGGDLPIFFYSAMELRSLILTISLLGLCGAWPVVPFRTVAVPLPASADHPWLQMRQRSPFADTIVPQCGRYNVWLRGPVATSSPEGTLGCQISTAYLWGDSFEFPRGHLRVPDLD